MSPDVGEFGLRWKMDQEGETSKSEQLSYLERKERGGQSKKDG